MERTTHGDQEERLELRRVSKKTKLEKEKSHDQEEEERLELRRVSKKTKLEKENQDELPITTPPPPPLPTRKKESFKIRFSQLIIWTKCLFIMRFRNESPFGFDFFPYDIFNIIVHLVNDLGLVFSCIDTLELLRVGDMVIEETGEILGFPNIRQIGNKLVLDGGDNSSGIFGNFGRTQINVIGKGDFFENVINIGGRTYTSGLCITGNDVKLNGRTYKLPSHKHRMILNNEIFLDGKKWNPPDDEDSSSAKRKEEKTEPEKRFFLHPETKISKIFISGATNIVKIPHKFIDFKEIDINGSGKMNFGDCVLDYLHLDVQGAGSCEIYQSLIKTLKLNVSGSGKVFGTDVTVNSADVTLSNAAGAKGIFVNQSIDVRVGGCAKAEFSKSHDCKVKKTASGTGYLSFKK